jgi:hypothetical protein
MALQICCARGADHRVARAAARHPHALPAAGDCVGRHDGHRVGVAVLADPRRSATLDSCAIPDSSAVRWHRISVCFFKCPTSATRSSLSYAPQRMPHTRFLPLDLARPRLGDAVRCAGGAWNLSTFADSKKKNRDVNHSTATRQGKSRSFRKGNKFTDKIHMVYELWFGCCFCTFPGIGIDMRKYEHSHTDWFGWMPLHRAPHFDVTWTRARTASPRRTCRRWPP